MAKPGQTLENPVTGERITFRTTIQNSDGKQWEAELLIPPYRGKIKVAHFHPTFAETFEIIAGAARYSVDGQEADANPGDVVSLPAGKPQIHPWSISNEPLHMRQRIQLDKPDLATLRKIEFFAETMFGLAQAGQVDKEGMPHPLQFAMIVKAMQPIGYMAGMPIPVQHVLFGALSGLGRLLGYSLEIQPKPQSVT